MKIILPVLTLLSMLAGSHALASLPDQYSDYDCTGNPQHFEGEFKTIIQVFEVDGRYTVYSTYAERYTKVRERVPLETSTLKTHKLFRDKSFFHARFHANWGLGRSSYTVNLLMESSVTSHPEKMDVLINSFSKAEPSGSWEPTPLFSHLSCVRQKITPIEYGDEIL